MDVRSITRQIDNLISPTVESLGYELVEVEYLNEHGRWILRLYIDSTGGVSLSDCERVSRAVSSLLDVEDAVPSRYNLEVSSPGENRPVRKLRDFERFSGSSIKVRTHNRIAGRRNFSGILKGVKGDRVRLFENGEDVEIPLGEISKARLKGQR